MMAKKFSIDRDLKKARELLESDSKLHDAIKQVTKATKDAKLYGNTAKRGALRVPYVNAEPLESAASWK